MPAPASLSEDWGMFLYVLEKDPIVVAGFVLIGIAGDLLVHIQRKILGAGGKIPVEYLRIRRQYGWSPWPAYLLLINCSMGVVCFIAGLFRLR